MFEFAFLLILAIGIFGMVAVDWTQGQPALKLLATLTALFVCAHLAQLIVAFLLLCVSVPVIALLSLIGAAL